MVRRVKLQHYTNPANSVERAFANRAYKNVIPGMFDDVNAPFHQHQQPMTSSPLLLQPRTFRHTLSSGAATLPVAEKNEAHLKIKNAAPLFLPSNVGTRDKMDELDSLAHSFFFEKLKNRYG